MGCPAGTKTRKGVVGRFLSVVVVSVSLLSWVILVRRGEIRSYTIPKEGRERAGPSSKAGPASLQWEIPSGWEEVPAEGMREGSFLVRGGGGGSADVSLVRLQGDGGGPVPNVNRWRQQLRLPLLPSDEILSQVETVETGQFKALVVDLTGASSRRMLAAICPLSEQTLFVKMVGDDSTVDGARDSFMNFLKSIRLPGG
jgi:hypothetical protein